MATWSQDQLQSERVMQCGGFAYLWDKLCLLCVAPAWSRAATLRPPSSVGPGVGEPSLRSEPEIGWVLWLHEDGGVSCELLIKFDGAIRSGVRGRLRHLTLGPQGKFLRIQRSHLWWGQTRPTGVHWCRKSQKLRLQRLAVQCWHFGEGCFTNLLFDVSLAALLTLLHLTRRADHVRTSSTHPEIPGWNSSRNDGRGQRSDESSIVERSMGGVVMRGKLWNT